MPYCGLWSSITPGETRNLTIPCTKGLADGDTVASVTSVTITPVIGADSGAAALLIGSAVLDATKMKVTQQVGGAFVINVTYELSFLILTTNGEKLRFWGRLACSTAH